MAKTPLILFFFFLTSSVIIGQIGPLSLGLDIVRPNSEFVDKSSFGYGLDCGYEKYLKKKFGLTIQLGGVVFKPINNNVSIQTSYSNGTLLSYNLLFIQLGLKFYFSDQNGGWYLGSHAGFSKHNYSYQIFSTYSDKSLLTSEKIFQIASVGVGYKAENKWDYNIMFNGIRGGIAAFNPSNYISLRISRTLFGDTKERP